MREEPDYERLARIWRTSLGQGEVVNGETAAVVLPPAVAVKAIKDVRKLRQNPTYTGVLELRDKVELNNERTRTN